MTKLETKIQNRVLSGLCSRYLGDVTFADVCCMVRRNTEYFLDAKDVNQAKIAAEVWRTVRMATA